MAEYGARVRLLCTGLYDRQVNTVIEDVLGLHGIRTRQTELDYELIEPLAQEKLDELIEALDGRLYHYCVAPANVVVKSELPDGRAFRQPVFLPLLRVGTSV